MAILILNRFPPHLVHFAEWLADAGEDLYLFTTERYAASFPDYTLVRGFSRYTESALLEVEALRLHAERPFRAILAVDETDIVRAARLRHRLGLPGQQPESALAFRDKVVMKEQAHAGGIPCPAFARLDSALDLHDFVALHGLPVILKPVDGMGAMHVRVLRSFADLEDVYRDGLPPRSMVEAFVDAPMYDADGLIVEGEVRFCSVGRYHSPGIAYQDPEDPGFLWELVPPDDHMYGLVRAFAERVVRALPAPPAASFHCEVFHLGGDQILLCEIASRSAGARITECIRQSYGVELDELWARHAAALPVTLEEPPHLRTLTASYLIPKRAGRLEAMIDVIPFPWVTEYQPRVARGFEAPAGMVSTVDTIGSVVFQADDVPQLRARTQELLAYVSTHVRWEPGA